MIHIPLHKKIFLKHPTIQPAYLYKFKENEIFLCCNNSRFDGYPITNIYKNFIMDTEYSYMFVDNDHNILNRIYDITGFKCNILDYHTKKLEIL